MSTPSLANITQQMNQVFSDHRISLDARREVAEVWAVDARGNAQRRIISSNPATRVKS